jgi:uncharacterized membrane protein
MNDYNVEQAQNKGEVLTPGRTVKGNLDYKIASMLCYTPVFLISLIAPIVWLATEPQSNKLLRFHSIQGLLLFAAAVVLNILNSMVFGTLIGILGGAAWHLLTFLSSAIGLAFLGLSIYGMYQTYQGNDFRLPVLGDIAQKNA